MASQQQGHMRAKYNSQTHKLKSYSPLVIHACQRAGRELREKMRSSELKRQKLERQPVTILLNVHGTRHYMLEED